MKTKILITLVLLIYTTLGYSEEISLYSNFMSYKVLKDSVWQDWTDWRECYIEIVWNTDSNSITLYNKNTEKVFKIDPSFQKIENDNSITTLYTVLESENNCLSIRFRNQHDGVKQLYIDYEDLVYCYNLI